MRLTVDNHREIFALFEWNRVYLPSDKNLDTVESLMNDILQVLLLKMCTDAYKVLVTRTAFVSKRDEEKGLQTLKACLAGCGQFFTKEDVMVKQVVDWVEHRIISGLKHTKVSHELSEALKTISKCLKAVMPANERVPPKLNAALN